VQLPLISLFIATGLDKLVAVRTAPGHSYLNDVEKQMGLLNVALANMSLERDRMDDEHEAAIRSENCMAAIRKKACTSDALKPAWLKATAGPIGAIGRRFGRLHCGARSVQVHAATTDNDVLSMQDVITDMVDENYTPSMTQKKHLRELPGVAAFIQAHCESSMYMFRIQKCKDPKCLTCTSERRSGELFDQISPHDPPLPSKARADDAHYLHYDALKGLPSDERARPSLDMHYDKEARAEKKAADRAQKKEKGEKIFTQEKARHYVE
jgi:hypothetical protein